jgi:hypothetical protein
MYRGQQSCKRRRRGVVEVEVECRWGEGGGGGLGAEGRTRGQEGQGEQARKLCECRQMQCARLAPSYIHNECVCSSSFYLNICWTSYITVNRIKSVLPIVQRWISNQINSQFIDLNSLYYSMFS